MGRGEIAEGGHSPTEGEGGETMGRPGELEGENGEREGGGGGSEGRGVSQKPPCFEARGLSKRLVPLPPPPRARTENPSALSQFPEATARRARGTPEACSALLKPASDTGTTQPTTPAARPTSATHGRAPCQLARIGAVAVAAPACSQCHACRSPAMSGGDPRSHGSRTALSTGLRP